MYDMITRYIFGATVHSIFVSQRYPYLYLVSIDPGVNS